MIRLLPAAFVGSLVAGMVWFTISVLVACLDYSAAQVLEPVPIRKDQRPDIRHCFKPDAAPLWDCIRHKEPKS